VAFAAKNYGCDATGITVAQTGAAFGNERIRDNGITSEQARILCLDYRNIPNDKKFTKIASLEMAEVRFELFLFVQVYLCHYSMLESGDMVLSCDRSMISWTTMVSSTSKSLVSDLTGSMRILTGASHSRVPLQI
jgi:hypothetical protein